MKILWVSANKFGYELLKEAVKLKGIQISSIIILDNSSSTIMYDGIEEKMWGKFGKKVYSIKNINSEEGLIRKLKPDVVILCGWRQKISDIILKIPPLGIIGFHPTLLPRGRGSAPIINTVLEGIKVSGVTMYYLDRGLDSGDIIGQKKYLINYEDHADDIYKKIIDTGKRLIREFLPVVMEGRVKRTPQNDSKATYFRKPSLNNSKIDLVTDTLDEVYIKIKAFSKPYRGAYIIKNGKKLIIWRAELRNL